MMNNNELFDIKMKEKFKNEVNKIPPNINEEFENTLIIIRNKECKNMTKLTKKKKISIIVASILFTLTITMQTTFAQEVVQKIIRSLSLNSITILENKNLKWEDKELPEVAKGKVFDKDKNVVEKITLSNKDEMYNADGEQVFDVDPDGTLITEKVQRENMEKNAKENPVENLIVEDSSKLNEYTCFDVKLPTYLPEGFEFDHGEFTKDTSFFFRSNSEKYKFVSLTFKNKETGEILPIIQTYISNTSKKPSSETCFNNIEKVSVNGADAIAGDEGIVWEVNDVRYLMYSNLGSAENIKIAESIK